MANFFSCALLKMKNFCIASSLEAPVTLWNVYFIALIPQISDRIKKVIWRLCIFFELSGWEQFSHVAFYILSASGTLK